MYPISTLYLPGRYKLPPWQFLLLLLILVGFNKTLSAQVQAGQFHLGGQFSFQAKSSLNIEPNLGLMLSPKWSIGLSVPPLEFYRSTNLNVVRLGVGPFVRRYFDLKSNFYALVHLQTEVRFNLNGGINKQTSFGVRLLPAISYFISPRFALEATIGEIAYASSHYRTANLEYDDHNSKVELRSTPVFSLRYYFPPASKSVKK
jgi:hypothetical protein